MGFKEIGGGGVGEKKSFGRGTEFLQFMAGGEGLFNNIIREKKVTHV